MSHELIANANSMNPDQMLSSLVSDLKSKQFLFSKKHVCFVCVL